MDALLITVTVLSLVVALVMSVVAWRALNEEKQRAAARVAALAAAADVPAKVRAAAPAGVTAPVVAERSSARPWRPASVEGELDMFASEAAAPDVALNAGFLGADVVAPRAGTHQRGLAVAAVVFAALLGAFAIARVGGGGQAEAGVAPAPLELLSLRHEREGANLAVTGLVRNPVDAAPVERVSAVVLLFDPQGAFVTSATAPIDFVKLGGGDESPFVVRMQAPASVARYRVSFRTGDGSVTHVDRRDLSSPASPVALTRQ